MSDAKNFYDFVSNENPFAFLKDYDKQEFKLIKHELEALQKIQPKFIPAIVDSSVLLNERTATINTVIRNGINENIMKGVSILNKNNIVHDILNHKIISNVGFVETSKKAAELSEIGFDPSNVKKHRYNMGALKYIIDVFKNYLDLDGMEDVVLDMYRLKSINKQKMLREKVYKAIKDKIDDDIYLKMNFDNDIVEDVYEEAENLHKLEIFFSEINY